jgi:hypothetical protein
MDEPKLQRRYDLLASEEAMRTNAPAELEALELFHRASITLAAGLEGVDVPFHPYPAPPEVSINSAVLNLSVIAVRVARALGTVVSTGYVLEAHALKRRLSEAHARLNAVMADPSGEYARKWLADQAPRGLRELARTHGSEELYDLYSESSHAKMGALNSWLAIPVGDRRAMPIGPMRDPGFANPMLVEAASECRDFAVVVGTVFDRTVPDLDRLDTDLLAAFARSFGDADARSSDSEGGGA